MTFPLVVYGNFGDEKVTSTTKIGSLPLGTPMVLPDGRIFRHARVGGTALVAGKLYESGSSVATGDGAYDDALTCATAAIGATTLTVTAGATTAVTTDLFADGFLSIASSTGTGVGRIHKVKSNNSTAAGSTFTVTLYETDGIKVATEGGTTKVGMLENRYSLVKLSTADTAIVGKFGVSCASAAASAYVWLQTKGEAVVFTGGTVLVRGEICVASTAVAGAVVPIVASTAGPTSAKAMLNIVGQALGTADTAGYAIVDLSLD